MGNLKQKIKVRLAKQSDIDDIYRIQVDNFQFPSTKYQLSSKIGSSLYVMYVAQYNDRVIGYTIIQPKSKKYNGMTLAFKTSIDKNYQKQGVASKLIDETTSHYDHIVCHVRHWNNDSIQLRLAKGFKIVAKIPRYYDSNGDTGIRMYRCKPGVKSRQSQLVVNESKQTKNVQMLKQCIKNIIKQMI